MSLKKNKDFRFTFQDSEGNLRVVYIQAHHHREEGKDSIKITITGDGVPLEAVTSVDDIAKRKITTQTELAP